MSQTRCVSLCSIIQPVPSLLHVVLISSLGARALMACATVVNKKLECNAERFTENGFDSSVFHCFPFQFQVPFTKCLFLPTD